MAQISNVRRIIVEDYPEDSREVVDKLAEVINNFMDEVTEMSQGNIDYDNLSRIKFTFDVVVDANGVPQGVRQINTGLRSYSGKIIIDAQSLQGGANVVSTPYIDLTNKGNGVFQINQIFGLPPGKKIRLTVEFIP